MNLRNAFRYIYIYRLNPTKAGWKHDLQPREKWRKKKPISGGDHRDNIVFTLRYS